MGRCLLPVDWRAADTQVKGRDPGVHDGRGPGEPSPWKFKDPDVDSRDVAKEGEAKTLRGDCCGLTMTQPFDPGVTVGQSEGTKCSVLS